MLPIAIDTGIVISDKRIKRLVVRKCAEENTLFIAYK
jgi:hypothetical protein